MPVASCRGYKGGKAIARREVRRAVDAAERRFERCWAQLLAIKRGTQRLAASLAEFQGNLASAIFDLSQLHAMLASESARRIKHKDAYRPAWFSRRMELLAEYQKVLVDAISIGRNLGDAFAWYFLQNDLELLRQHSREDTQPTMSTGIGGRGELEFARRVVRSGQHFVLHHCITNMLKLGDVTLIDVATLKAAGIGELKTHSPADGQLTITLLACASGIAPQTSPQQPVGKANRVEGLSAVAQARLDRQLKRMSDAVSAAAKKPDQAMSLETRLRLRHLDRLVRCARIDRMDYARAGGGLVLFSYRERPRPLFAQLSKGRLGAEVPTAPPGTERIAEYAQAVMLSDRQDNALFTGSLPYGWDGISHHLPGMTHVFWWPISARTLKSLIFQRVFVGTLYNPAWLFQALERKGFAVNADDPWSPVVTKQAGDVVMRMEGFSYYYRAIQRYLMEEDFVAEIAARTLPAAKDLGCASGRIDLMIYQRFGKPNQP